MSEIQIQPGGTHIPDSTRVATDQTTIAGDGSAENPLHAIGTGGVDVDEGGTPVVTAASVINFTGAGVTVTDGGGGIADVNIPTGAGIGGAGTAPHLAVFSDPGTITDSPVTIGGTGNLDAIVPGFALAPALTPVALAAFPTVIDFDPGAANAVIRVTPDIGGSYLGTLKSYFGPGEIRVIRNIGGDDEQNSGPLIIMQDVAGGTFQTFHLEGRRPNLVVPSLGTIMVQLDDTDKWFVMAMNGVGNINYNRFILPAELPPGETDNWQPFDATTNEAYDFVDWIVAIADDGGSTVTGLNYVVSAGSGFGRRHKISNFGNGKLTLAHNSASSTAINRFFCPGEVDFTIPTFGSVWVTEYNDQLWLIDSVVVGGSGP